MMKKEPATVSAEAQLKFRVDKTLRASLEEAAKKNGVSLNREITDRLTRSLDRVPGELDETKPIYGLLKLVYRAMDAAGKSDLFNRTHSWEIALQTDWMDDGPSYEQAMAAAIEVLRAFKPKARSALPDKPVWDEHGLFWAEFFLHQVATGRANVPDNQRMVDSLRSSLGPLAERVVDGYSDIDPNERAHAHARALLSEKKRK
jgi:hypothetical protein